MPIPTVYFEREALLSILYAAVEVYNRECLGVIFGKKISGDPPKFIVTAARSWAAVVRRTNAEVHVSQRALQRVNRLLEAPNLFSYLGDFHSHPLLRDVEPLPNPSQLDVQMLASEEQKEGECLGVIISIAQRKRKRDRWRLMDHRTLLHGSLQEFECNIVVHQLAHDEDGERIRDSSGDLVSRRLCIRISRSTRHALNSV